MYRLTCKKGSILFSELDDLFSFVFLHVDSIFDDGAYIKIFIDGGF